MVQRPLSEVLRIQVLGLVLRRLNLPKKIRSSSSDGRFELPIIIIISKEFPFFLLSRILAVLGV